MFELEKQLHTFEVRSDRQKISALLSNDFFEFGSSGKIWTRSTILDDLPTEDGKTKIQSSDYKAIQLSTEVILVTYQSNKVVEDKVTGSYLRSSIWREEGNRWVMEFHQGTPTGSAQIDPF